MLKPLLLLCCAATIVSAGEPKNDAQNNATLSPLETPKIPIKIKIQNADQELSTTTSNTNVHATSELTGGENIVIIPTTVLPQTTHSTSTTTPSTKPTPTPTKPTPTPTKPTTTTTKPTTTSTSTTVTPAPTTSTTPAPTPLPPPSTARWVVHQNKTLCIIVEVAAQLNISYVDNSNVTIQKALDIPVNGTVTGNCGTNEQSLKFSWKSQNDSINDTFTLHFVKNETEKHYSLHHLEIFLVLTESPNDKSNKTVTLVHVVPQFNTGLSNSYRCFKEQILNLTLENKNTTTVGHLKVSNLQFQAFRGDNSTTFGIAQDCSFNTPDIVPITVGCALAGLVVVVLIAYLVGRRRSQARGYLSM